MREVEEKRSSLEEKFLRREIEQGGEMRASRGNDRSVVSFSKYPLRREHCTLETWLYFSLVCLLVVAQRYVLYFHEVNELEVSDFQLLSSGSISSSFLILFQISHRTTTTTVNDKIINRR